MSTTSLVRTDAKRTVTAAVETATRAPEGGLRAAAGGRALEDRLSLGIKAVLDYAIAGTLALLLAPVFVTIALAIKLTSRGPIFFVQQRVGKDGRIFNFYKFRTMKHNSDDAVHRNFSREFICGQRAKEEGPMPRAHKLDERRVYKLTRDPRVTRVGHFLRRTSLDELPQLFNVLRGEMSMVGPRPPVVYELEHYQDWHKQRLVAKPGITGLWQVSGRSSVPFDEMVLLDLYYIENRSTAMDLRIMAKTLPVMIKGDGAY